MWCALNRYPLGRFEHVVSMKVMKLRSQETITGRKEFIVVGTTSVCGEDIQCKGKVNHTHTHQHDVTLI